MRGRLYHGHYLIISPLHRHGEVANENPLILPRTLSIVGALVLLKRRAGKKMRAPLLGLPKSIYYVPLVQYQISNNKCCDQKGTASLLDMRIETSCLEFFSYFFFN